MPKQRSRPSPAYNPSLKIAAHLALRQYMLYVYDTKNPSDEEGEQVVIKIFGGSGKGIDLSNYTVAELDIFQKFMNKAVELARPICEELDRETEEARARNDIRYRRIWRAEPRYIDLTEGTDAEQTEHPNVPGESDESGNEREHDQGLPSRPGGIVDLGGTEREGNSSESNPGDNGSGISE